MPPRLTPVPPQAQPQAPPLPILGQNLPGVIPVGSLVPFLPGNILFGTLPPNPFWFLQWGSLVGTPAANSLLTIPFTRAFPSALAWALAGAGDTAQNLGVVRITSGGWALNQFVVECLNNVGVGVGNAGNVRVNWVAIGC